NFFKTYIWNNVIIQVLPGVFGYHGVDPGSLLLMSTFKANIYGKVLDIGSGSGILSVLLIKQSKKKINLTLSDINSEALISSKKTLKSNNISGNVIASDLFSHITNKFNLIISNPPLHDDLKFSRNTIKELIQQSVHYLHNKGELRIVVSNFLSYSKKIKKIFGNCSILKSTNCFKVYQAFLVNKSF
ncbi:methyltransferase, partial [Buchnera aphidicola (Hormaphis cornu)]